MQCCALSQFNMCTCMQVATYHYDITPIKPTDMVGIRGMSITDVTHMDWKLYLVQVGGPWVDSAAWVHSQPHATLSSTLSMAAQYSKPSLLVEAGWLHYSFWRLIACVWVPDYHCMATAEQQGGWVLYCCGTPGLGLTARSIALHCTAGVLRPGGPQRSV